MFSDLQFQDEDAFQSIIWLLTNTNEEDIEYLYLTFSSLIVQEDIQFFKEIELIPGGADVFVTAENKVFFLSLASFHCRLSSSSSSFRWIT